MERLRLTKGAAEAVPAIGPGRRFAAFWTRSAPETTDLSQPHGWPARFPTDDSPSRVTAHGSGPIWIAIPLSQFDSHQLHFAGLPAHPRRSPTPVAASER